MKRSFSDYTENEFLEFVRKFFNVADISESEDIKTYWSLSA